jgi:hypothetical protein
MPSKQNRKLALAATPVPELRSSMTGNGGRFAPNNGYPDIAPKATSAHEDKEIPFRVLGTTSGAYSTEVAGNSTVLYRDER